MKQDSFNTPKDTSWSDPWGGSYAGRRLWAFLLLGGGDPVIGIKLMEARRIGELVCQNQEAGNLVCIS